MTSGAATHADKDRFSTVYTFTPSFIPHRTRRGPTTPTHLSIQTPTPSLKMRNARGSMHDILRGSLIGHVTASQRSQCQNPLHSRSRFALLQII